MRNQEALLLPSWKSWKEETHAADIERRHKGDLQHATAGGPAVSRQGRLVIRATGLQMNFGTRRILDGIDLDVPRGSVTAVIGQNGAGKSTTFRIVGGLLHADAGMVHVMDGTARRRVRPSDIGFLPEERSLFQDVKVRETLQFWGELRGLSAKAARLSSTYWLERFDLVSCAQVRVSSLSKGNQQKLQLAACLIHAPGYVILDEPFSGLDPANQELIADLLDELASSGAGVLLSAHQLSLVEAAATEIFVLHNGVLKQADRLFDHDMSATPETRPRAIRIVSDDSCRIHAALSRVSLPYLREDRADGVYITLEAVTDTTYFATLAALADPCNALVVTPVAEDLHGRYLRFIRDSAPCEGKT